MQEIWVVVRSRSGGDLPLSFFGQALLVLKGQNLPGHLDAGFNHKPSKFLTKFALEPSQFGLVGVASLGNDVRSSCDGLLGLDLRNPGRCGLGFFDDPIGLFAGLSHEVLCPAMGHGQVLASAGRISESLSDGCSAVF